MTALLRGPIEEEGAICDSCGSRVGPAGCCATIAWRTQLIEDLLVDHIPPCTCGHGLAIHEEGRCTQQIGPRCCPCPGYVAITIDALEVLRAVVAAQVDDAAVRQAKAILAADHIYRGKRHD